MKTSILSKKIYQGGCLIEPSNEKTIFQLKKKELANIFERKGLIIFRNFNLKKENITKFTDIFTEQYANDAMRRSSRLKDKKIRDVDPGNFEMPLHSEASYSPSWPEIIWFYCNIAPKKSGKTTVCDGKSIYDNLSVNEKKFFLENQILYDLKIPFGEKNKEKKVNKKSLKPWHIDHPGVKDCFIDFLNKEVMFKLKRYAVSKLNSSDELAFVNHLQIILDRDPQVIKITMEDGKKFPNKIMKKVKKVSDEFTVDINWKDGDLCMINNKRFMHGRRKISFKEKRDIVVIQTLKSNFKDSLQANNS